MSTISLETCTCTSHCQILHQRYRKYVNNVLVSRIRVRLEKSVVTHVARKCPLLYGLWRFIVVFTAAHYSMLGWCKYTQSTSSLHVHCLIRVNGSVQVQGRALNCVTPRACRQLAQPLIRTNNVSCPLLWLLSRLIHKIA